MSATRRAIVKRFSRLWVEITFAAAVMAMSQCSLQFTPPSCAQSGFFKREQAAQFTIAPEFRTATIGNAPPFRFATHQPCDPLPAGWQIPSIGRLAIQKPLARNQRDKLRHALSIADKARIPAVFKFAGVFRKMFRRDAMPSPKNRAFH